MNAGLVAERVYDALRGRLLDGEWRPGERLDPVLLADTLASSSTPVRDALNRLTGEQLVETRTGGGFFVPGIDEPGLIDLLGWHAELLHLAIRNWPSGVRGIGEPPGPATQRASPGTEADRWPLFAQIAALSSNCEHRSAQARIAARLHAAGRVEPWPDGALGAELSGIAEAARQGERPRLRSLLFAFHRKRQRIAALLVRRLYRDFPG